jgi:hypothetical protein
MDLLSKQILHQQVMKLLKDRPDWFTSKRNDGRDTSNSFLLLAVSAYLSCEIDEARRLIVDGGDDAGIDALNVEILPDDDFEITFFQAKYSWKDLEKNPNFPANAVQRLVQTVKCFFDTSRSLQLHSELNARREEVLSLIEEGKFPRVRVVFLGNGQRWNSEGQSHIDNAGLSTAAIVWFSHEDIFKANKKPEDIKVDFRLQGKATLENFEFKRVIIGRVPVTEIAKLVEKFGDGLFDKNVRRFLGVPKNRVNQAIRGSLISDEESPLFYFLNNGITMICRKFRHSEFSESNWMVQTEGLQIVNGGQTSKTIQETIQASPDFDFSRAFVLVRLYEVEFDSDNSSWFVSKITLATNSQTPIDLRDLRSNEIIQLQLVESIKLLGYQYIPKRSGLVTSDNKSIPSSVAAEAVLAVWRQKPHLARFKSSELFGKFYEEIFQANAGTTALNAAQLIMAVLVFRYADARRKDSNQLHPEPINIHRPYSYYFAAMLMGKSLLANVPVTLPMLNPNTFPTVLERWEKTREVLYTKAMESISDAIAQQLSSVSSHDPRRISALFRRGDILNTLLGDSKSVNFFS